MCGGRLVAASGGSHVVCGPSGPRLLCVWARAGLGSNNPRPLRGATTWGVAWAGRCRAVCGKCSDGGSAREGAALGHTGGVTDLRLIQIARLLGLDRDTLTETAARAAIAAAPAAFATVLFAEAADNDDVTSATAALDYLETRLLFFGELVPHPDSVREAFRVLTLAWE